MVVGDALDAFPECCRAEVHQQTERKVHQSKVGEKLLAVNRSEAFAGFQLDQQPALDEQVCAESLVQSEAAKLNRNRLLPLDGLSALLREPNNKSLSR